MQLLSPRATSTLSCAAVATRTAVICYLRSINNKQEVNKGHITTLHHHLTSNPVNQLKRALCIEYY